MKLSSKELNPHNYKEGRFKYPINHRSCGRTIYFYKTKPHFGEIPAYELTQRISLEQPLPEQGGRGSCPYCIERILMINMTVDEAQEME